jgi:FixJ family two-component response regulator
MVRVARGWTNKGIAKDLDISPATVKTFIERLLRLSGAENRTALAQWWREGEAARAREIRSCERTNPLTRERADREASVQPPVQLRRGLTA